MPAASLDAVVTDPPYRREYGPLYGQIAAELPRVLKRGGSFLAIVPHYALPQVLAAVGRHLKYRWTLCMWQEQGAHPRMAMGIEVVWKPIVWWVNGAWPVGRGFIADGIVNQPAEKRHHPWEQSLSWTDHVVKLVPERGVVLDPLMGSGSTGISCVRKGRRFIGIDSDPAAVAIAARRLREGCGGHDDGDNDLPAPA
jgi:DNA modification methylase